VPRTAQNGINSRRQPCSDNSMQSDDENNTDKDDDDDDNSDNRIYHTGGSKNWHMFCTH